MTEFFKKPAPSFDEPLDMLSACHERIGDQCATLIKLARHLPTHGADAQARQAATNVLRYFDTAGRHHHEDEERDLFPVLRAADYANAIALVEQLLRDHVEMEQAWKGLRVKLVAVRDGAAFHLPLDEVEHFAELYRRHIEREETLLLPLAERVLSPDQLTDLASSMVRRRQIHAKK